MNVVVNRQLPTTLAMPAIDEALRDLLGDVYTGVSSGENGITIHISDSATDEQLNNARDLVLNHDMATRTDEQTAAASRLVSYEAAKSAITTQLSNIAADDTTLASSPTSGQILTVLQRMVDREALVWQLFDYLVKDALA